MLKTIDTEELAQSIIRVWEGDTVISPEMMGKWVALLRGAPAVAVQPAEPPLNTAGSPSPAQAAAPDDPIHSLSPREGEILRLIARGDSNKLIARALDIAETTVKIHVQHILRKLGLSNRVHAAVYASERDWT